MAEHRYTLTPSRRARRDTDEIYRYTLRNYGADAADNYNRLLRQAYIDISADPFRPGSKERHEIGANVRSFHISLSKTRAKSSVKSPRHFVIYFLPKENEVLVARILHDAQDLARHVPRTGLGEPPENAVFREPKTPERGGQER